MSDSTAACLPACVSAVACVSGLLSSVLPLLASPAGQGARVPGGSSGCSHLYCQHCTDVRRVLLFSAAHPCERVTCELHFHQWSMR